MQCLLLYLSILTSPYYFIISILNENMFFISALKYHTSKISSFEDVSIVTTFGFRGEALSSLCAIADVHVLTATANDTPIGTKLEFDHRGNILNQSTISREKGENYTMTFLF